VRVLVVLRCRCTAGCVLRVLRCRCTAGCVLDRGGVLADMNEAALLVLLCAAGALGATRAPVASVFVVPTLAVGLRRVRGLLWVTGPLGVW
jgi:hypothetical protein